ncbi:MAG: hypothetical protein PHF86_07060 [Candidatus Nanoarchaeia archaeon]|nr:hypothetical protein [Candidatus Nanoarchaeia archaeon]
MAEENIVKIVNNLVQESFGKRFRGDWNNSVDMFCQDKIGKGTLNLIGRRLWYPLPYIFEKWEYLGRFTSEDGSRLKVFEDYVEEAKKYVQLYKEKIGKDAQFVIVEAL